MVNQGKLPEMVEPNSRLDGKSSDEDVTDSVPKKPGSKAQGRKRTKTGCLSKLAQ